MSTTTTRLTPLVAALVPFPKSLQTLPSLPFFFFRRLTHHYYPLLRLQTHQVQKALSRPRLPHPSQFSVSPSSPYLPALPQTQPPSLPLFHPIVCHSTFDPFNSLSKNFVVLPPMDSLATEPGFLTLNSNPYSSKHARTGVIQVTSLSNSRLPPLPPTLG